VARASSPQSYSEFKQRVSRGDAEIAEKTRNGFVFKWRGTLCRDRGGRVMRNGGSNAKGRRREETRRKRDRETGRFAEGGDWKEDVRARNTDFFTRRSGGRGEDKREFVVKWRGTLCRDRGDARRATTSDFQREDAKTRSREDNSDRPLTDFLSPRSPRLRVKLSVSVMHHPSPVTTERAPPIYK